MYESAFEKNVCKCIRDLGGKAYKWVSPGNPGVPDRICVLPGARVVFIEVKRPGLADGLSPRQKKVHGFLMSLGLEVWRIADMETLHIRLRRLGYEI